MLRLCLGRWDKINIIVFLKKWIIDIVILFVLVSLVEIIIPNSNIKKYINVVTGLIIIIVIIAPFINLIDQSYDIDNEVYKTIIDDFISVETNESMLLSVQEEQIKETYLNKIKEDIEEIVNKESDYKAAQINISLDEGEENYGSIKEVDLILKNEDIEESKSEEAINLINIEEIKINEAKQETDDLAEFQDNNIKNQIVEKYNLPEDKIRIYIDNNNKEGEHGGENNYKN